MPSVRVPEKGAPKFKKPAKTKGLKRKRDEEELAELERRVSEFVCLYPPPPKPTNVGGVGLMGDGRWEIGFASDRVHGIAIDKADGGGPAHGAFQDADRHPAKGHPARAEGS